MGQQIGEGSGIKVCQTGHGLGTEVHPDDKLSVDLGLEVAIEIGVTQTQTVLGA